MARLPIFPRLSLNIPDIAELERWGNSLIQVVQNDIDAIRQNYQRRASPTECPAALSSQLNTTGPIYRPNLGKLVVVTDASGGAEMAYGDTSAWRLVRTKAAV